MTPLPPIQPLAAMPLMPAQVVAPAQVATPAAAAEGTAPARGTGFADALTGALSRLNADQNTASALQRDVATGAAQDPTQAVLATEQASIEMQLAVQVRNKLVESWQELSRMQV